MSSQVVVCPKLEQVVLVLLFETFDIRNFTEMAIARASRGKKLRSVIVDGKDAPDPEAVLELRKHVWNVEYGLGLGAANNGSG
jgi:hypothetical protein